MKLTAFIAKVSYNLRGLDDSAPVIGTEEWIYWVSLANDKKDEMAEDSNQGWQSDFEDRVVSTVSAGLDTEYSIDSDFLTPSAQAYVIDTDGQYHYFDFIKAKERDRRTQAVYLTGKRGNQSLRFSAEILEDDELVGGELHLPGDWLAKDIDPAKANAVIPVDSPIWLAMAVAAEAAFNDITYEDKYGDLVGKANNLYKKMTRRNRRGTQGTARVSPTSVKRITGFR